METLQQFTSLHKAKTSFAYRLIRISTQKDPYWKPFEIAALCIEYFQPMALLLLLQYDLTSDSDLSWLEDLIHSLAHLFDFSHLLNLDDPLSTTILTVIAFCILSLFKLVIFLYIIRAAFKADKQEGLLKTLWRIIFFFQARVLCFFISSFWFGLFASFNDFFADIQNSIKYVIAVSGCTFIFMEYLISFVGTQYFHYLLPSKHIMGTKSNIVVMMTLTQKLVLQVIHMAIPLDSNITIWAHLIVDLFSNIAKVYYFLRILPAYNSKALLLKANLLTIAISLDLASFSYKIADLLDYPVHIDFLLALWVLFSIMGVQIMRSYLRQFLMDILTKPTKSQPELFIHKVYLLREFMEYKEEVNGERVSWDWKNMIKDYVNQNFQGILEVESSNHDVNSPEFLDSPEIFNKLCLKYLNASLAKYPKNRLLKLYTAYYYAKRVKKQTVALRLLSELRNSADSSIKFNACLLVDDIQEILKNTYEHTNSTNNLDIYHYDRNRYGILKIKSRMIKQANIQTSLYQEMGQNSPNLGNVFEKAQSIFAYKRVIKKKVRAFLETCPDYYLRPIALLAQYNLLLNHHLPEYAEYMKRLAEKHKKYEKFFHSQELCEENLYHKATGITFISGAKEKMGTITYASKPMLQLYGTNPIGQDIQHYMLPFLQKQTSRKGFEIGEYLTSTPISPVFIYNNNSGYIVPVSNYMNIHPSIRRGLQYISFNRPLNDCKEYIILSEDNAIQAFTERIATKLNLASLTEAHPSIGVNIEDICPDFVDINKAFNLIEHPSRIDIDEKEEPLDPVKAKNLYETYSTVGNRINIKPLNTGISSSKDQKSQYSLSPKDQKPHYSFHCTITNKLYGQTFAKILELKEIKRAKKGQTPTTRGSLEEKPFSGQVNLIVPGQNTTEKLSQIHMQVPSQSVFRTYTVETEEVTSPGLHAKKPGDDSPAKREVAIVASSLNSQKSSISTHITKMKAFNAALESSYYHRMYILFIFLLFVLLITVLCSQSVMKVVVSNYADSLKTRTDVLIMAGTRNLKLMDIHRNMRYLWLYATGQQNPDDMTTEIVKIPGALSRLSSFMPDLGTMNRNLRNTVNLLDSDMAQLEFEKDIRMYETIESDPDQKYINMTSFEAVDNIIADTLQIIQKVGVDLNSTAEPIAIVLRNILNDMFVETENTVRLFLSSLDTDSSKNSTIIIMSLIGIVLLVVVCLGIFLTILYLQYSTEKVNMLSLTRLNANKIIAVQQQVAKFIKMIEEEAIFEDVPLVDVTEFYYQKTSNDFTLDKAKQADDRSDPRYSRIRRKYLIFTVKITVLMACLAVFIIVNLAISQSFVENLNKKAHQVQSVNTLVEKITLSASIIIDMASENDTTTILNTPTQELLLETIQDISSGKNQVLDIYSSSDTQQAELLEPLLFENQCAQILSSLADICWTLIKGQSSAGFIQLTTYAEFALTDYQNRFDASDRTTAALQAFQFETVNTLAPNIVIVQQLGNLVLSAVDADLESNIETNLNKHTVILSLLCVFSVVMCVLIYDVIFLKVREADTQFRRVLQVFPANLILSNFNLKSYLIRTTHKRLDFV